MHAHWIPTSKLDDAQHRWLEGFLANQPWYRFYYSCAMDDLRGDLDNRAFVIGRHGQGLLMLMAFQGIDVVSIVGEVETDELAAVAASHKPGEVHCDPGQMDAIVAALGTRAEASDGFLYMERRGGSAGDGEGATRLGLADVPRVLRFYREHYPETTLSPWMLQDWPFAGVVEDGELVACAGTVVMDAERTAAHLGHFATHPGHRGRGLAQRCGRELIAAHAERGVEHLMLGVAEANRAAVRVYQHLGFGVVLHRHLVRVGPGTPI